MMDQDLKCSFLKLSSLELSKTIRFSLSVRWKLLLIVIIGERKVIDDRTTLIESVRVGSLTCDGVRQTLTPNFNKFLTKKNFETNNAES